MEINTHANPSRETTRRAVGRRPATFGGRRRASLRLRPAFTLTELLVVIAIIAVLASLITVAAVNAIGASKQARILTEINQISQTLEDFKNDYGVYPPNGMNDGSNVAIDFVASDFVRMFKKAFPRSKENPLLLRAIAGESNGSFQGLQNGLWASEAVYFWLGGFSDDPEYPISGQGGPSFNVNSAQGEVLEDRNRRYEFDLTRLGPRNENGGFDTSDNRFIQYPDPRDNSITRQINFWNYTPSGFETAFIYYDVSRHKPYQYAMPAAFGETQVTGLVKLREGFTGTPTANDLVYVNQDKYQVLHAGIDDDWGDNYELFSYYSVVVEGNGNPQQVGLYPDGPFTGGMADNLANFASGTLEDAAEE